MARVDELIAELLARERRVDELMAELLEGDSSDGSSDDEDEVDVMMIKDEILTRLHRVEARLCAVEAKVDDCAAAEFQQQPVRAAPVGLCGIESPRIEIDVATAAAATTMFQRAVTAKLTAAAVVWWGDSEEEVVVMEDVVRFGDWVREWGAMVRWCGGGWWRRLLLIE